MADFQPGTEHGEQAGNAGGTAAHGYFELTDSLAEFSKADIFQRVGERTPLFTRFSTVAGNRGSTDLARDVRGFAVKNRRQAFRARGSVEPGAGCYRSGGANCRPPLVHSAFGPRARPSGVIERSYMSP